MKNFTTALATISLMCGTSQASVAQAEITAPATDTCSAANPFTWSHLGGAPFVSMKGKTAKQAEAEAMKKLPIALDHMIAAGCLPAGAKDGALKMILENPEGTIVDGTHKPVTLTNGMRLDFMDSANHYYVDIIVGLVNVGRGLVAGVQAKVWAFTYNGVVYYIYMPFICYNWSLAHRGAPPPPPVEQQCYTIQTDIEETDKSMRAALFGPDSLKGPCWHWDYEGQSEHHSYQECPDRNCNYEGLADQVNHMELKFKTKVTLSPPPGARYIRWSVSREFAIHNYNMALFCRERADGMKSCGNMARFDDYDMTGMAEMFLDKPAYLASGRRTRIIVWDFYSDPLDCLKFYTH